MTGAERLVLLLAAVLSVAAYWAALSPPTKLVLFTLAMLAGMPVIRKGQVREVGGRDMRAQANFAAELFQVAA